MERTANRSDLAMLLQVDRTTIDTWIRAGMPYQEKPIRKGVGQWKFDVAAVFRWRMEQERSAALGEVDQIDEGEARRRKMAAEAGMAELEYATAQGSAVSIADFEASMAAMIGAARSKARGLGAKLARRVAECEEAAACQSLIDDGVDEFLQELSDFDGPLPEQRIGTSESVGGDAESGETMATSPAADGKRMGGRRAKAQS